MFAIVKVATITGFASAAPGPTDGNGFNIQLETVPLDGRLALRVASEKSN